MSSPRTHPDDAIATDCTPMIAETTATHFVVFLIGVLMEFTPATYAQFSFRRLVLTQVVDGHCLFCGDEKARLRAAEVIF
jgi:hypothetical protein